MKNTRDKKLNFYLLKLDSIKNSIKNKTSEYIDLLKTNEAKLLDEINRIEQSTKSKLTPPQEELDEAAALLPLKLSVQNNALTEDNLYN